MSTFAGLLEGLPQFVAMRKGDVFARRVGHVGMGWCIILLIDG